MTNDAPTGAPAGSPSGLVTPSKTSVSGAPAMPMLLGPGLAQEAVSQAAAMAVQDAGTYFRQVAAVSAAAVAVFTAKMVEKETPEPWTTLIEKVNTNIQNAGQTFQQVGTNAAAVLKSFSAS